MSGILAYLSSSLSPSLRLLPQKLTTDISPSLCHIISPHTRPKFLKPPQSLPPPHHRDTQTHTNKPHHHYHHHHAHPPTPSPSPSPSPNPNITNPPPSPSPLHQNPLLLPPISSPSLRLFSLNPPFRLTIPTFSARYVRLPRSLSPRMCSSCATWCRSARYSVSRRLTSWCMCWVRASRRVGWKGNMCCDDGDGHRDGSGVDSTKDTAAVTQAAGSFLRFSSAGSAARLGEAGLTSAGGLCQG